MAALQEAQQDVVERGEPGVPPGVLGVGDPGRELPAGGAEDVGRLDGDRGQFRGRQPEQRPGRERVDAEVHAGLAAVVDDPLRDLVQAADARGEPVAPAVGTLQLQTRPEGDDERQVRRGQAAVAARGDPAHVVPVIGDQAPQRRGGQPEARGDDLTRLAHSSSVREVRSVPPEAAAPAARTVCSPPLSCQDSAHDLHRGQVDRQAGVRRPLPRAHEGVHGGHAAPSRATSSSSGTSPWTRRTPTPSSRRSRTTRPRRT